MEAAHGRRTVPVMHRAGHEESDYPSSKRANRACETAIYGQFILAPSVRRFHREGKNHIPKGISAPWPS